MGKKKNRKTRSKKKYTKPKPKPQTQIHVGILKRAPHGAVIDIETVDGFTGRMWVIDQSDEHIQSIGRTLFKDQFPDDVWG